MRCRLVVPQRVPSLLMTVGAILCALFIVALPVLSGEGNAGSDDREGGDGGVGIECGVDVILQPRLVPLAAGELQRADPGLDGRKTTNITLRAGIGLATHPEALTAWRRAVAIWESWLEDPVAITLAGDLQLLPPNVLGSTTPLGFLVAYNDIRDALLAEAEPDENVVAGVPTLSQLNVMLPPGFSFANTMAVTMANLKALGLSAGPYDSEPDAEIIFSTSFLHRFDFDPSDGIDADKVDFEAVVVHEIGHALGFGTIVDIVDYLRSQGQVDQVPLYTLDCFRLQPGRGAVGFTSASRVLTTGDLQGEHVFFEGVADVAMSTGVELGDGKQASHWKDDQLSGVFLGIMDPTLSPGVREELTEVDLRAFGLIGWDVASEPHAPPDPPDGTPPDRFAVTRVYPNPFNPQVSFEFTVEFSVPVAAEVRLDVFDLRGRKVTQVGPFVYPTGLNVITWNGTTPRGTRVGSGVYFLRLVTGLGTEIRKVMLVK